MFLSVDLEGSTKLKQNIGKNSDSWAAAICLFYLHFLSLYDSEIEQLATAEKIALARPPVWKTLGDEIVFSVEVLDQTETLLVFKAFHNSITKWNQGVKESPREHSKPVGNARGRLRVKGAAWFAGFPVCNVILEHIQGREDYTGPSIDAGFRLSKLASPRRIALSVEAAWFLLASKYEHNIFFNGTTFLKGLRDDPGYPVLWTESPDSPYASLENVMQGLVCCQEDLQTLCQAFITEHGIPSHTPFFGEDHPLANRPQSYSYDYTVVVGFLRGEVYLVQDDDNTGKVISNEDRNDLVSGIIKETADEEGGRSDEDAVHLNDTAK